MDIRPIQVLRPPAERAGAVAAPPYDVVDTAQARALAAGNPDSFLHISRPEIALPDETDPHSEQVYAAGRAALAAFVERGALRLDDEPRLLAYRLRMPHGLGHVEQTGLVCGTSVADYAAGRIAVHEHTRPDKEDDRVRHMAALDAHDEPVLLMHRPVAAIDALIESASAGEPEYDVLAADGIQHALWLIDGDVAEALIAEFAAVPRIYVADGHHRSAAAARLAESGAPGTEVFPSVLFSADQLTVLPYNRVVTDLAGLTADQLLDGCAAEFAVGPGPSGEMGRRGEIGMYLDGQWHHLTAYGVDEGDPIGRLDVALLQDRILGPLLGIEDPRRDPRIAFVGGSHGIAELERRVDSGAAAVAFSLHPTSVEEVMDVADAGLVMPPKSTWFEPKLRSGFFVHPFSR